MKRVKWILLILLGILLFSGCQKDFMVNNNEDSYAMSPITDYSYLVGCGPNGVFEYGSIVGFISLKWECGNCEQRSGFNIYRNMVNDFNSAVLIANLGPNIFNYYDDNVESDTDYYYFITVVYPIGESEPTEVTGGVRSKWEVKPTGLNSYYSDEKLYFAWNPIRHPEFEDYQIYVWRDGILWDTYYAYDNNFYVAHPGSSTWEISVMVYPNSCWSDKFGPSFTKP